MVNRKRDGRSDEHLDRVGREILRVSAMNEDEAEMAASSPFLYTRLRSRIAEERKRREEGEGWLALFGVAWRAVPAMALTTIFALALFLSVNLGTGSTGNFSDEALFSLPDAEIERLVFADGRQALSSDEVLATIMDAEEQEVSR